MMPSIEASAGGTEGRFMVSGDPRREGNRIPAGRKVAAGSREETRTECLCRNNRPPTQSNPAASSPAVIGSPFSLRFVFCFLLAAMLGPVSPAHAAEKEMPAFGDSVEFAPFVVKG